MRQIPKNRIIENQYSAGLLRFSISKVPYIGFYNVINGSKYFTGKTYTESSKPLEKYNILKTAASAVAAAGSIATSISVLRNPNDIRYFYKDTTSKDILIKEINKDAYSKLNGKDSMTYQVISYNPQNQTLEEVDTQMPGLKTFLET